MPIIHLRNGEEFAEILNSHPAVVADFYSTECPPCEALAPIYEKMSEVHADVTFVKIMRQDNRDLAESYYVMSSPTVLFFRDGKLLDTRLSGRIAEPELEEAIEGLLKNT